MADAIEEAFVAASSLIFGKTLSPMGKYEQWLRRRIPAGKSAASALGRGSAYLPDYGFLAKIAGGRAVSLEDSAKASGLEIEKEAFGGDGKITIAAIARQLQKIAYFAPTFEEGRNIGISNTAVCIDCLNVRDSFDPFTTKNSAHCFSVMDSEAIFGMFRITKSAFSIHCYNCTGMLRCFEMDACKECSDSMFCHNCEGLSDCMFCFNVKNKRYAIGNRELPREEYLKAKKMIVGEMLAMLERGGGLKFDIYDVLCAGRK